MSLIALTLPATARAAGQLTGPMAVFDASVGNWNCSTSVPAFAGKPAHVEQVTLTFDVVPGNVAHDHVAGANYSGDDYFGYSDDAHAYWIASADSSGAHGSSTSTDAKTFTGTTNYGPVTMAVTSVFQKIDATHFALHNAMSTNGQKITTDTTCSQ